MTKNKKNEKVSGDGSKLRVGDKSERSENSADPLSNYVTGHIRYTIYGPDKYLPKQMKRFRVMNRGEFIKYNKKVEDSGGFDVDGCTGSLPGGIFRAAPTTPWWAQAVTAAEFAVKKHAEDGGPLNLEYKQLLKANVQPVQGDMFYLTFTAIDKADGVEKVYRSKLWAPPYDLRLQSLECYTGYEKSAEEMRLEIIATILSAQELCVFLSPRSRRILRPELS